MNEWDEIADSYEEAFEPTTSGFVPSYTDRIAPGSRVADVACGPGVITAALADRGCSVAASDFSPAMVDRLRARVDAAGHGDRVLAFVADGQSLPIATNSVDVLTSNFGIIFCPDIHAALREAARVAREFAIFTAWTSETRNGWTSLLTTDYANALGFTIPVRPMYKFSSIDDVRAACISCGWRDVQIETHDAKSTVVASWARIADVLSTPATRIALSALTHEQVEALSRYLERRAREVYGEAEVVLPREAWLVEGRTD